MPDLSLHETYAGKRILLSGTTGFLGKVVLSLLLTKFPSVGHIYVLIRPGPSDRAKDRFQKKVMTSPAMRPVAEAHPNDLDEFIASKVTPVDGNIVKPDCGLTPETLAELREKGLDLILNSAGLVDFDPSVDSALTINAIGTQNVVKLGKELGAAIVHVSTCFVAGQRSGQILEDEPVLGRLPDAQDPRASDFDHEREIQRLGELAAEVRTRADDPATKAQWRREAIAKLADEGRDASDGVALKAAVLRQKKVWLGQELKRVGMERARFWGWTNTYTFTKAIGEMVIAKAADEGMAAAIVRPSIVESAHTFPLPGWNEGFTTTAPLILMIRQGLLHFPYADDLILDVIPCDMVASAIVAAGAAVLTRTHKLVYQAASGDVNPLTIRKALELTAYEGKMRARSRDTKVRYSRPGPALVEWFKRHYETQPLHVSTFNRFSTPRFKAMATSVIKTIDDIGPDRMGWMREPMSTVRDIAEFVDESSSKVGMVLDLFMPFVAENKYVFRCDNTRGLMQRLAPEDRDALYWRPESYTWRDYFIGTHIPGLEKYVFPEMQDELAEKPKLAHMHRDLIDMFESTTYANRHRVAARFLEGDTFEHLTYGELRLLAERISAFVLAKLGEQADKRVMLVCENRPEWIAAYFGILRAGYTVVPVDAFASAEHIKDIAKVADVSGIIASPAVIERSGLDDAWSLQDAVRFKDRLIVPKAPARVASLVFTNGSAKGVMLSHRNFTFEVSRLAGIFPLDTKDHLLSVLPLHHSFEFTAGMLVPLSRGATVTYLNELNGDTLQRALENGVTGLIGVPALWELLQQRIESRVNEQTRLAGLVLDGIQVVNNFLRQHTELNFGPLLAYPVHRALGGRLKYLVSSGSSLSPEVLAFFRGVGFNMTEGYALTEAAPIVTVTDPLDPMVPGSVGRPLHGVDVMIDQPNAEGIGEVLMRGPNVMVGYWGSDAKPLENGWLRTGDMGRMDAEGRLFLVGRKGAELDRFGQHPAIREVADQRALEAARVSDPQDAEHVAVPVSVARAGKRLLQWTQRKFYDHVMNVAVTGRDYVPRDQGFIVAANHTSHLDAGLVQQALGDYGRNIVPLAAADYFFSTKTRRAYFEHFTNVRPLARRGEYDAVFADALAVLKRGESLVFFPEGTRSLDGNMQPFQESVGFLAMHSGRAVVPMYLTGTHDAMPKGGTLMPRRRHIGAVIGTPLTPELFAALGEPGPKTYALATAVIERAVRALRDHGSYRINDLVLKPVPAAQRPALEPDEIIEELEPPRREVVRARAFAIHAAGADDAE